MCHYIDTRAMAVKPNIKLEGEEGLKIKVQRLFGTAHPLKLKYKDEPHMLSIVNDECLRMAKAASLSLTTTGTPRLELWCFDEE